MRRVAAPKLVAYAGLAALGLLAGLVLGLPELVALAAPFALLAGVGLAIAERPQLRIESRIKPDLILEGEEVAGELVLHADAAIERLDVLLDVPPALELVEGESPISLHLGAGESRTLELRYRCLRWGGYVVGEALFRAHDRFGLVIHERRFGEGRRLKVYPRPEPVQWLLRPLETQVFSGNQVAREKSEGIEFADLRPFLPGDRIRRINWRASARRDELWVNELHAERNADVVLFLDSFAEVRRESGSTLDRAVRATAALAGHYLRQKDRVGLVSFGGVLSWLLPSTGLVQAYRILDSLIDTEILLNYAWKDLEVIPRRTLPPKALVVALTPLLDERAVGALLDLRARGFDLAIVEVSPVPFLHRGRDDIARLAYRLWLLHRQALRGRYERAGVPVAVWDDETPFSGAIEELREFRRRAPRAARA